MTKFRNLIVGFQVVSILLFFIINVIDNFTFSRSLHHISISIFIWLWPVVFICFPILLTLISVKQGNSVIRSVSRMVGISYIVLITLSIIMYFVILPFKPHAKCEGGACAFDVLVIVAPLVLFVIVFVTSLCIGYFFRRYLSNHNNSAK